MKYKAFTLKSSSKLYQIKTEISVNYNNETIQAFAIWDTGASGTCISKRIAESLKAIPIGMNRINTAAGLVDCNDYLVDIVLPNNVIMQNVRVSEFAGGPNIDILIGMDIISQGDLAITNANGFTVVSFRVPSDAFHIDYVATSKSNKQGKLAKSQLRKKQISHQ